MNKEEEEELRAYIKRMEADVAFKDAKIRRLEGEIRMLLAQCQQLAEDMEEID